MLLMPSSGSFVAANEVVAAHTIIAASLAVAVVDVIADLGWVAVQLGLFVVEMKAAFDSP